MQLATYIQTIQLHLIKTHQLVLNWFEVPEAVQSFRPVDQGWTISEILEHIALTSHFLLILIDKAAQKSLAFDAQLLEDYLQQSPLNLDKIDQIGIYKSFVWVRPEHMEPTGKKSALEVKNELISQLQRCMNHLENLKNGAGLQYKTTMSVQALGKLNVYEYIYFLSKHAERHLTQMEENKAEFLG
jgi:hypothetical protein